MDDIIVVIITLVIMVVGAINQMRKKQKQPLPDSAPEKETGSNFWEEFLDVKDDSAELQDIVVEKVVEPKVPVPLEPIIEPPAKEGMPAIQDNYIKDVIKNTEIGSLKKKARLPEGFSLRRAVIFSEIIEHKYF